MSLTTNALVTLDQAFAILGWASGSHGGDVANVESVIESVSRAFNGVIGCTLAKTVYTAVKYDGSGKSYLLLPHWPITTFTSLSEDGAVLTAGTHFLVNYALGILEKESCYGKWTTSLQGILTTYTAGYDITGTLTNPLPGDIKLAAQVEVARQYDVIDKKMFGESSRTIEGVSITINTDELLPSTLTTLARYRRVRF
jgi:hypothetical protein